MPNIQDLNVLPQGGHGYLPVAAAAIDEKQALLASLDQEASLILWDIPSGKQLVDISLTAWDENLPADAEGVSYPFDSRQVHPEKIQPNRLLIRENSLYAYGRNGVFRFDLSTIYDRPYPTWVRFFGNAEEDTLELDLFGMSSGKKYPTGKVSFDCSCEQGTLSAGNTHYLYKYEGSLYKEGISEDKEEVKISFTEEDLGFPTASIRKLAYDEENKQLAVVTGNTDNASSGQATFFELKGSRQLTREESFPVRLPCWLSPAADYVLWAEAGDDQGFPSQWRLCKKGVSTQVEFQHLIKIDGDILQLDYTPESNCCAITTFRRLRVYRLDENPVELIRFDQPGFNRGEESPSGSLIKNKFKPLTLSPSGRFMLSVPGWLNAEGTSIRPSNGTLYLANLERSTVERTLNAPRPKIHNLELAERSGDEYLDVFFDNGAICTLQLGDAFELAKKYDPMDFKIRYTCAVSNPVRDEVVILQKDKPQLVRGQTISPLPVPSDAPLLEAAYSPNGRHLAAATADGRVLIMDTEKFTVLAEWTIVPRPPKDKAKTEVQCLTFHPDKSLLAAAWSLSPLTVQVDVFDWEAEDLPLQEVIGLSSRGRFSLRFSPAGRFLVFTGIGNTRVWDVEHQFEKPLTDPGMDDQEALAKEKMAFGRDLIHQAFTTTFDSPLFLADDSSLLVERKDVRLIEIWEMDALRKSLRSANGSDTSEEKPLFVVNTRGIPYSSFRLMKQHPVILFFRERDEWVKLVNYESGQLLAALFPFDNRQLLMLDQKNYYYTSREGYDLAAFRLENKVFPMEQFDLMINRPDLVFASIGFSPETQVRQFEQAYEKRMQKLLEDRIEQMFDLIPEPVLRSMEPEMLKTFREKVTNEEFSLPDARIKDKDEISGSTTKKELSFEVSVKTTGPEDRLLQMNIHVNNVPIYGKNGIPLHWGRLASYMDGVQLEAKRCNNELKIAIVTAEDGALTFNFSIKKLKLSSGENKIQVSVLNTDGIEAYDTLYVNLASKSKPKLHFIGIAVGDHDHEDLKSLHFPEPDMGKFVKALEQSVGKDSEIIVNTLPAMEDTSDDNKPMRARIRNFLKEEKAKLEDANVDDRVILFYSGHGDRDSIDWKLVLSCRDMNPADFSTGLPYEELEDFLDGIAPRNKLLIVDACESGELDQEGLQKNTSSLQIGALTQVTALFNLVRKTFVDLRRGTGATVLSASQGDQDAFDSVLITHLTEGLAKGNRRISQLAHYLTAEVPGRMVRESLNNGPLKEETKLKDEMAKAILKLLSLELSQEQLKKRLTDELTAGFAHKFPGDFDIEDSIVEPLLNNLQQPTVRAFNMANDWSIW